MKTNVLLTLIGCLTVGGWAAAQQQQLLDHGSAVHMQQMQDASCPASSGSGGQ